jgi:hypothetical protein
VANDVLGQKDERIRVSASATQPTRHSSLAQLGQGLGARWYSFEVRWTLAVLGCVVSLPGSGCFLDRSGLVNTEGIDAGQERDGGPDAGVVRRDSGPDCVPTGSDFCDDVDNDCDGLVDEDFISSSCDSDDDDLCFDDGTACTDGAQVCADDGESDGELEICDGLDNDCRTDTADGEQDPAMGTPCDGDDTDLCVEGSIASCVDSVLVCDDDASEEDTDLECDGNDGDCDGVVDDDAASDCPCAHANSPDGHSYFFCSADATWIAARNICEGRGYILAHIDDAAENQWIADRLPNGDGYWIGATDDAAYSTEGTFVWYDDAPPRTAVPYSNWSMNEPSNGGGIENCAEIDRDVTPSSGVRGGWNDDDCPATGGQGYVCEAAP